MTAAVAGVTPPASGQAQQPKVVWAMTVTGRRVPVTKPTGPSTPVHPEKITHPGLDFMGSTVAAHTLGEVILAGRSLWDEDQEGRDRLLRL